MQRRPSGKDAHTSCRFSFLYNDSNSASVSQIQYPKFSLLNEVSVLIHPCSPWIWASDRCRNGVGALPIGTTAGVTFSMRSRLPRICPLMKEFASHQRPPATHHHCVSGKRPATVNVGQEGDCESTDARSEMFFQLIKGLLAMMSMPNWLQIVT